MERKQFWVSDMEAVLGIVVVLVIIGTINVFSSSFILGENNFGSPYHFLIRQAVNLGIGLVFFLIGWLVDYHRWRKLIVPVVGITVGALVLVLLVGVVVNGSRRWLNLVLFQLQPAELAKLVSVMLIAAYLAYRVKHRQKINIINLQTMLIAVMGLLIELEPDAGTMGIVVGVPGLMLCLAGLERRKILTLGGAAIAGFIGICILQPYRLARLRVLFDPWADAQNIGYQTVQSLATIGSGGFWGMGLGMGISKYDYLPEAHTDFAFAVFCQENGFIGAIFVLILFAAFAFYGTRIANRARDIYGQILAIGIVLLIEVQAVINLLMVGGVFPVIGVPLPFVSYGGTSLIVSLAAIGMLINIGIHGYGQKTLEEESQEPEEEDSASHGAHLRLVK